jgi:hypothetical protein
MLDKDFFKTYIQDMPLKNDNSGCIKAAANVTSNEFIM